MRGEFGTSVHIYQLEEQRKVLVAVCDERALGLGWVGHPERDIYTVNLQEDLQISKHGVKNTNFISLPILPSPVGTLFCSGQTQRINCLRPEGKLD